MVLDMDVVLDNAEVADLDDEDRDPPCRQWMVIILIFYSSQ